jgi:hypothetical protein
VKIAFGVICFGLGVAFAIGTADDEHVRQAINEAKLIVPAGRLTP